MILRKPYAFFIKYFKFFHLIVSLIIGYLIFNTNKLINFFSSYLLKFNSVVGQKIIENYFSSFNFLCIGLIAIISLIIFSVMFKKDKPYKFYVINIFIYIAITVVFVYTKIVLLSMETLILNIKVVKLMHDILVLSVIFESITLIVFLTRGLGLNFRKFDFSSDISKFEIDSKDNEEFEVNVELDFSSTRKNLRKKIRFFKYSFLESKFKIFIACVVLIVIAIFATLYLYINKEKIYSEEVEVYSNGVNYVVNSSYLLKKYDKYLMVVDIDLNSYYKNKVMYLNDLYVNVEGYKLKNTLKYCSLLSEYGICYNNEVLSTKFTNFIVVYEVPEIYINSKFVFQYITENNSIKTKLTPVKENFKKNEKEYKLGELLEFEEKVLKGANFEIDAFEIQNFYKLSYDYNVGYYNVVSTEYLRPSLDTNFDKSILKLDVSYDSNNSNYKTFYMMFNKYGSIRYYINGVEYIQKSEFEEIESSRINLRDVYIGINREIMTADKIDLVIDIRDKRYIYSIKGSD